MNKDKLNFYTVDLNYVNYLQRAEMSSRGFSRVPNMDYGNSRKPKFLCGVVLNINNKDYYVPVSSYKQQKPDNFLIKANNGQVVSSLRFNYMFPIPKELTQVRSIDNEPDRAYRTLLSQELHYCVNNQTTIQQLAERTYRRVLLGKDKGLVANSCDFLKLENALDIYKAQQLLSQTPIQQQHVQLSVFTTSMNRSTGTPNLQIPDTDSSIRGKFAWAKQQAEQENAKRQNTGKQIDLSKNRPGNDERT